MNVKLLVLGLFLSLVSFQTIAQSEYRSGYIIRPTSDTVKGFLEFHRQYDNLIPTIGLKENLKQPAVIFQPAELLGFGYDDGRFFRSMLLPKDSLPAGKVFVHVIAEGPMSLYHYDNYFFVIHDSITTVLPIPHELESRTRKHINEVQQSTIQKDRRYAGLLGYLLQDCHINTNRIGYYDSDLGNAVSAYNKCKGFVPLVRKVKKIPFLQLHGSILAGYSESSILTHDYLTILKLSYRNSYTVPVGAGFDITFPRLYNKLLLTFEAHYAKSVYQGYAIGPYDGYTLHLDQTSTVSYWKLPVGLRYNILKTTNTPYVKAGYSLLFFQKKKKFNTLEERETFSGVVNSDHYTTAPATIVNTYGFWFSVGYERQLVGKARIFAEFRGETYSGLFRVDDPLSTYYGVIDGSTINYSLLIGFRL